VSRPRKPLFPPKSRHLSLIPPLTLPAHRQPQTHRRPRLARRVAVYGRSSLRRSSSGSLAKFAASRRALSSCESRSVSERMRWPVKQL